MSSEEHQIFKQMIDQTLAGEMPGEIPEKKQASLREHLAWCADCQEYLAAGNRVVAGLSGFSFEVDPNLRAKISVSLAMRSQQLKAAHPGRQRWMWGLCLALLCTVAGSLLELQVSGWLASVLNTHRLQVQHEMLAFWIVPSLCLLLLFPILPWLSEAAMQGKGKAL